MLKQYSKNYILVNDKSVLKKKYLMNYHFSPGLYAKLCSIDLYIDKNYDFELFLFFHELHLKDFLTSNKSARIYINLKGKLPYKVRKSVYAFFESDVKLKENYFNDRNVYGMTDRNENSYIINHKNGYFSLDMTPDILDKNLFKSKHEINFLKLATLIEKWCTKLRDDLMKDYGHKKNS